MEGALGSQCRYFHVGRGMALVAREAAIDRRPKRGPVCAQALRLKSRKPPSMEAGRQDDRLTVIAADVEAAWGPRTAPEGQVGSGGKVVRRLAAPNDAGRRGKAAPVQRLRRRVHLSTERGSIINWEGGSGSGQHWVGPGGRGSSHVSRHTLSQGLEGSVLGLEGSVVGRVTPWLLRRGGVA